MTSLNVRLPEALREFIVAQVETGKYATASDFIRELLRERFERDLGHSMPAPERLRALAALLAKQESA